MPPKKESKADAKAGKKGEEAANPPDPPASQPVAGNRFGTIKNFLFGPDKLIPLDPKIQTFETLAQDSSNVTAWIQQARQLYDAGDLRTGNLVVLTVLEAVPNNMKCILMYLKASMEMSSTEVRRAETLVREAYEALKQSGAPSIVVEQALGLATAMKARDNTLSVVARTALRQESIQLLRSAMERSGAATSPCLRYTLAVVLAETGQVDAAVELLTESIARKEMYTFKPGPVDRNLGTRPLTLHLMALLLSSRGELKEALDVLAVIGQPGPETPVNTVDVLTARIRARVYMHMDDGTRGCEVLADEIRRLRSVGAQETDKGKAAALVKMEGQLLLELSTILCMGGSYDAALEAVEIAAAEIPNGSGVREAKAGVHLALGELDAALDLLNTAVTLDPQSWEALKLLGILYRRRGGSADMFLSYDYLTESLLRDPTQSITWYELAIVCRTTGRAQEAESHAYHAMMVKRVQPVLPFHEMTLMPLVQAMLLA